MISQVVDTAPNACHLVNVPLPWTLPANQVEPLPREQREMNHYHTIVTPHRTFKVSTTHDATTCQGCAVSAANAVSLARVTGSREASCEDGQHVALAMSATHYPVVVG